MAMLAICPRSLKRRLSKHEQRKLLGMRPHKEHFKLTMLTNYNFKVLLLLLFMVCINRVY